MAGIYLDNNATTPVLPEVAEAMFEVLKLGPRNPSSAHSLGDEARKLLDEARCRTARIVNANPEDIIFTGSGTEANNQVLRCFARAGRGRCTIVTTEAEHSSILRCCDALEIEGHQVIRLPIQRDGLVALDSVKAAFEHEADLVSIHWVNNETGVKQPVEAIAQLCHSRGVPLHLDAAQAVGKIPIGVDTDALTFTSHKIHGPMGVGVVAAKGRITLWPTIYGGGQEGGTRAGTENLPGIVGHGLACEIRTQRFPDVVHRLERLRDHFEGRVMAEIPDVEVNGSVSSRVCNTSNLLFRGVDGQALLAQLDVAGIYCSQSSACTNMRPEPSYVLRAMGLTEAEAYSSVRFSFSELNTLEEIDEAVDVIARTSRTLRSHPPETSPASPKELAL